MIGDCFFGRLQQSIINNEQSTIIKPFTNINSLQIFQALQFGTAILIGILLAKSGLPTGQISVYEALMFIGSLYCFFWVVGGQNTLLQLFPRLDEAAQKRALFNVFLLFTLAGAVTGGVLFLTQDLVNQHLTNFDELPHLDLLAWFLVFNSPTFLIQIFYLLLKKYQAIVVFGSVSFGLQLVAVVLPIFLGMTLRETMWGLLFWSVFKFVWGLVLLVRHTRWQLDFNFLKNYLPLLFPLLILAAIGKGSEYVSGLVVTTLFKDENAFAVFRFGAREFPLAVLMVGALVTSLLPEVSGNQALGNKRIKETTRKLSHWLYPVSMVSMLAAPLVFPLVFNSDFKESAKIFNIFTLLLASRILLPQVVAMGHQKNHILALAATLELLVLVALSGWWGRLFGLEGVAWAAVAAFMVDRIVLIFYNWRVLKIPPGNYIDWKNWLVYNALLVAVFLVSLQF